MGHVAEIGIHRGTFFVFIVTQEKVKKISCNQRHLKKMCVVLLVIRL